MSKSALASRLDKLESLLAAKLQGPVVTIWIPEGKTLAEVLAEGIADGSIPPNARATGIEGWRERRGEARPGPLVKAVRWLDEEEARQQPDWEEPQPPKEPLAIAPPLKRIAFEEGSAQQLATEADPPDDDSPYRRRRAVVLPKQKGDFHKRIVYPKKNGAA